MASAIVMVSTPPLDVPVGNRSGHASDRVYGAEIDYRTATAPLMAGITVLQPRKPTKD